jgi:uncharacterized protein (TIGR02118 family)
MAKLIGLFHRKEGTSVAEFRTYYEDHHAPFAAAHFGHLFASYTRNYVDEASAPGKPSAIDVVTEIVFHDDAALQEMFAMTEADPALREAIGADEAAFMDRSASRILLVTEHESSPLGAG